MRVVRHAGRARAGEVCAACNRVGLGLAIMEVSSQARLGYFDAPMVIEAMGSYVSPWFLGMIVTAAGAYLFALVGRVSWLGLFGYAVNALAWEDVLYWAVRWHVHHMSGSSTCTAPQYPTS